jgi:hypothetical protein
MTRLKRARNNAVGFSNPFEADSEVKKNLFRELQERLSIDVPESTSYEYDDTNLDLLFGYLKLEVEYLLSLRPPELDEEIPNEVIYVDLETSYDSEFDGSTWDKALNTFSRGLSRYRDLFLLDKKPRQIWVASSTTVITGVSTIIGPYNEGTARHELFFPGMKVYGGFDGNETSIAQRTGKTASRRMFQIRNIMESGFTDISDIMFGGGYDESRAVWGDYDELSDWSKNPIVVDGFSFDYDVFDSSGDTLSFIEDKYGSEKGIISNCIFDYGQSQTISKNRDSQSVTNVIDFEMINLQSSHTIKNSEFIGYILDWETTRDFTNPNALDGGTYTVKNMINASQTTFRTCEFRDFTLDLTGISGDDGVSAGDSGRDATYFDIEPVIQADSIITCTFTNVSLVHNAYSCNGGDGVDYFDDAYPDSVSADEFQSPFWVSGPDDAIRTFTGAIGGVGGAGGDSQYGQSGAGGSGGKGSPSLRLLESATQDGAIEYSTPTTEYELNNNILYIQNTSNGGDGGDGGSSGKYVSGKGSSGGGGIGATGQAPQTDESLSGYTFVDEVSSPRSDPTYLANTSVVGSDGANGINQEYDLELYPFIDFEENWPYYTNTFIPIP